MLILITDFSGGGPAMEPKRKSYLFKLPKKPFIGPPRMADYVKQISQSSKVMVIVGCV